MELGTLILQTDPWSRATQLWREVEASGVDRAYVADHLTHPAMVGDWVADPWVTLGAAAVATTTLGLGTLVASAATRSPVLLARAASTLHDVSNGRFVLGLGAGNPLDAKAERGSDETTATLSRRFADVVHGLKAVWAGDEGYAGRVLSVDGVHCAPHAPGRTAPPLVLAAHGPTGLELVAREGDGWTAYGGARIVGVQRREFWDVVGAQAAALTETCERLGRDPASLRRSVLVGYAGYRPLESVASFEDEAAAATAAGFDELCFYWPTDVIGGVLAADVDVVCQAIAAVHGRVAS